MGASAASNARARKNATTRRQDWRPRFLEAYAAIGTIKGAAEACGIDRRTVQRERQRNESFALEWLEVEEALTDELERVAVQRAIDGSDRLLEFLLKAKRPELYRENVRVEHSGAMPVSTTVVLDDELAKDARSVLRRAAAARGD